MTINRTLVLAGMLLAFPLARAGVDVPPNKTIDRILLGGHRDIGPDRLQLISKPFAPCSSPPFTSAEFSRIAPRGAIRDVVTVVDGKRVITRSLTLPGRNDKRARTVSLAHYVSEVNAAELFFNQHGYTLRRGALSLRQQGRPDLPRRGACVQRNEVPGLRDALALVRYRLVDPDRPLRGVVPDHHIDLPITKPVKDGPGDVMQAIFQPGVSLIRHPDLTAAGKQFASVHLPAKGGFQGGRGAAGQALKSACAAACINHLGEGTELQFFAKMLLDDPDHVAHTILVCPNQGQTPETCTSPLKTEEITHRKHWSNFIDVEFFLANWNRPCDVIAHEKSGKNHPELIYKFSEQSEGDETSIVGQVAKSFFDGVLGFSRKAVKDCALDAGSNGLFGSQFCLVYESNNSYTPETGFAIGNSAGLKTEVTLFGYSFDLLSGEARIDWTQPVPKNQPVTLVQPGTSTSLPQTGQSQHFEGPGATFAIGPVPLTVRTFADAGMGVGQPEPVFIAPALDTMSSATGTIGMKVGAGTDVSVGMDAAIDAFVLSAGVSGQLSLLSNKLSGGIKTILSPAANQLTVEKGYQFDATSMKGSISAFVEIDLLIYSERYSVEIISFPGVTKTVAPPALVWGPASAVIPATAVSGPVCK